MLQINVQLFGGRSSQFSPNMSSTHGMADTSTQAFHARQVETLRSDVYPDYKTYDLSTLTVKEYSSGYQVTFSQIGDSYTGEEYADKVNEFLKASSDGVTSAGKFEGTPEVSFHVNSRASAVRLAKKYNQISVWDWENQVEIQTGGTGRRN